MRLDCQELHLGHDKKKLILPDCSNENKTQSAQYQILGNTYTCIKIIKILKIIYFTPKIFRLLYDIILTADGAQCTTFLKICILFIID